MKKTSSVSTRLTSPSRQRALLIAAIFFLAALISIMIIDPGPVSAEARVKAPTAPQFRI